MVDDAEDGYANASPTETTKRFPQGFGNLAKNARFPHSHSHYSFCGREKNRRTEKTRQRLDQPLTVSVAVS
jgi:hypothetical protein